jgi:hypothetical protein
MLLKVSEHAYDQCCCPNCTLVLYSGLVFLFFSGVGFSAFSWLLMVFGFLVTSEISTSLS